MLPFGWRSTRGVRVGGPLLPSAHPLESAADRPPRQVVVIVVTPRRSRRSRAVGPPPYSFQEVRLLFLQFAPPDGGAPGFFRCSRREGVERLAEATTTLVTKTAGVKRRWRRVRRHSRSLALGGLGGLLRPRRHARLVTDGDPRHLLHHHLTWAPYNRADDHFCVSLRRHGWSDGMFSTGSHLRRKIKT